MEIFLNILAGIMIMVSLLTNVKIIRANCNMNYGASKSTRSNFLSVFLTIISCSRIGYDVKDNRQDAEKLVCFDHLE